MDNEASLSIGTDKLLGLKLSLKGILGENWKQNSICPNLQQALPPEEFSLLEAAKDVDPQEAKTDTEKFVAKANDIFTNNKLSYKAQLLTDKNENQLVYITGKIGNDTIYQIARSSEVESITDVRGVGIKWIAERMGIIGKDG